MCAGKRLQHQPLTVGDSILYLSTYRNLRRARSARCGLSAVVGHALKEITSKIVRSHDQNGVSLYLRDLLHGRLEDVRVLLGLRPSGFGGVSRKVPMLRDAPGLGNYVLTSSTEGSSQCHQTLVKAAPADGVMLRHGTLSNAAALMEISQKLDCFRAALTTWLPIQSKVLQGPDLQEAVCSFA